MIVYEKPCGLGPEYLWAKTDRPGDTERKYNTIVPRIVKAGWRGGNMSWAGYDESGMYREDFDIF